MKELSSQDRETLIIRSEESRSDRGVCARAILAIIQHIEAEEGYRQEQQEYN